MGELFKIDNDYWSGRLFVYRATIINGAAIATPTCILTPGVDNEFELYHGTVSHNDATASNVDVHIRDEDANVQAYLYDVDAVTQNSVCQFPSAPQAAATAGNAADAPAASRFLISGTMDLYIAAVDIDATEGITVTIVGRIRGGLPTIAETGGGTPTITITTERIY